MSQSHIAKPLPGEQEEVPVAAYCRVSTEEASQEESLESQRAHWLQVVQTHAGWTLVDVYAERLSATHADNRPELTRLIGDCARGRVRVVLTKSVSRFSRNTVDCLRLVRTLKARGVRILFDKEHIDTGSMSSELFLSIMASFAAEESRSISGNVKLGYRQRFQAGEFRYKRPPYGYKVADGSLEVLPEEAAVVEEIFACALRGMRPGAIAAMLEARGVPTKYRVTWQPSTVTAILTNLTYTGDALLQKTYRDGEFRQHVNRGEADQFYVPERHEGIVSREVFVLANQTLGFGDPYARIRAAEAEEKPGAVQVIKARERGSGTDDGPLRVAAYCRVSTDLEEQESSYAAQCAHYHDLIVNHPGWALAGIFADEGISGTSLARRDGFNRMIEEAEAGRIDLILTKSISRFARNTLDCLTVVRRLKAKGVGVTFEKEGIDTLDGQGEVLLTILASIAQQESASISQNIRLGIQYRFQRGLPMVNCNRFLGYDKDARGRLVVNEDQAEVVRRVYRDFLDGYSLDMIAGFLRREGVPSGSGCTTWRPSAVRYLLTNEKYAGDLLLQKTFVSDFLTHKNEKNRGQLPSYRVRDAHPPVIPREVFERAADELWLRSNCGKKGGMRFGSRRALVGRTLCPCGGGMKRLRRIETVFTCPACGREVLEGALKRQVLDAVAALPAQAEEIHQLRRELAPALASEDPAVRAPARRKDWYLGNLLPQDGPVRHRPDCADVDDFRARTRRSAEFWNDGTINRLLDHVVAGVETVFKGGVSVRE